MKSEKLLNAMGNIRDELIVGAMDSGTERRPRRLRKGLAVALAAAMVLTLAVGAGAAGGVKPLKDLFAPILGGDVAQTEIIDKVGRPIGASATSNGITMTADAIIGDKYNAVIVFTLTRDDGSRLLPEGVEAQEISALGGAYLLGNTGSSYRHRFWDDDPEDNEIQFAQMINGDGGPLEQGNIKSWFTEFYYYPDGDSSDPESLVGIDPVPLFQGNWEMRFEVAYEDCSVTLSQGETTESGGVSCTMREVTVSPIAVTAMFTTDCAYGEIDGTQFERDGGLPILVRKTDGTEITFPMYNFGWSPVEQPDDTKPALVTESDFLPEITPLEEIESVVIGDIEYKVNP